MQIKSKFFPSNSCLYVCAHRTTMPIASAFVYFLVIKISFLKQQKKRRLRHRSVTRLLFMTGFSVVRRRSVPSGQRPFYCIYIGFFCCPPTLRPKVRHPFRILGASRTRGMTPSIHLYYMQNRQKSQQGTLENYFACILPVWRSISCRLLGSTPPGENILFF